MPPGMGAKAASVPISSKKKLDIAKDDEKADDAKDPEVLIRMPGLANFGTDSSVRRMSPDSNSPQGLTRAATMPFAMMGGQSTDVGPALRPGSDIWVLKVGVPDKLIDVSSPKS